MLRLFLLLISISTSYSAVVTWTPNKSFNLPINFKNHKLPCSKQTIVFPETIWEAVKIDTDVSLSGLVLPMSGELVMEDGGFDFGVPANENCTEEGYSYYLPRSKSSWAQPDVWSSPKYNEATPDAERVPCYDDEVVFPLNSQFTIFLPKVTQHVRKLSIFDYPIDTRSFRMIVYVSNREPAILRSQQYVPNDNAESGVVIEDKGCASAVGCPCQENVLQIDCTVKFCLTPKCINPIQPIGHCCKICGGYLLLDIGQSFDMKAFEDNVIEVINYYGKESLVYHIGILKDNKVQLVVVERDEFVGLSAEAVHEIENKISGRGLRGVAQISGAPISKAGMGGKIAVSMFFLVILVLGAIYVYYYKVQDLLEGRFPIMNRNAGGVISRFNRRTESVVSLTSRRDSTATIGSGIGIAGTAFRNPLYSSKRGRVEVAESTVEE